jgi:hypothetical protein
MQTLARLAQHGDRGRGTDRLILLLPPVAVSEDFPRPVIFLGSSCGLRQAATNWSGSEAKRASKVYGSGALRQRESTVTTCTMRSPDSSISMTWASGPAVTPSRGIVTISMSTFCTCCLTCAGVHRRSGPPPRTGTSWISGHVGFGRRPCSQMQVTGGWCLQRPKALNPFRTVRRLDLKSDTARTEALREIPACYLGERSV